MKALETSGKFTAALILGTWLLTGCESTDGGSAHVGGGVYYSTGIYDPWYYGPGYYPPGVIVTPPPEQPERPVAPPQPSHPIVRPTPPSIPATPRPMPRPAMRR